MRLSAGATVHDNGTMADIEKPGPPPQIEVLEDVGAGFLVWARNALLYLLDRDSQLAGQMSDTVAFSYHSQQSAPRMGTPYHQAPWRTGTKIFRTIYATQRDRRARASDPLIGMMDTPEAAREAVAAHNNRLSRAAGR